MAKIGWIDFSQQDRRKVKRILSLIRPEGQLDELGIGRIRDGLANRLFPGVSTIQTRAKYFFIVPYILRDYAYLSHAERRKRPLVRYLEDEQEDVKERLKSKYAGQDNTGIIGITLSNGSRIVRPPSEIYWVGISSFGCIKAQGLSLYKYLNKLESLNNFDIAPSREEEDIRDDAAAVYEAEHHIRVPAAPNWKEGIDIELTKMEADFLQAAFIDKQNIELTDSVFRSIFQNDQLMTVFRQSNNFPEFASKAVLLPGISPILKELLILAHDFTHMIDGAHILYNHFLQKQFFPEEYADEYLQSFWAWHAALPDTMIGFQDFNITALKQWAADVYPFLQKWWELTNEGYTDKETAFIMMEKELRRREHLSKGRKARLQRSREANSDLRPGKRIGLKLLSYRFENAKRIVEDIFKGIEDA